MAGASCDDVFVIVLFSTFTGMAQGGSAGLKDFASIPVSIILGIGLGAFTGFILGLFFEEAHKRGHSIRNSVKIIVILGVAFLLVSRFPGNKAEKPDSPFRPFGGCKCSHSP